MAITRRLSSSLAGGTVAVLLAWLAQSCGGAESKTEPEAGAPDASAVDAAIDATAPDATVDVAPDVDTSDPCWRGAVKIVNNSNDLARFPIPSPASVPGLPHPTSYDASAEGGIVYDNVTGLTWLRSSADYSFHAEAGAGCDALDASLPTRLELTTIQNWGNADPDANAPGVDQTAFTDNAQDYYWSSTNDATRATFWWVVSFHFLGFGATPAEDGVLNAYSRCVRRPPPKAGAPAHRYEVSELCGRVRDVHAHLEWERAAGSPGPYLAGVAHCDTLNADAGIPADAGAGRWRIPTYGELMSLVLTSRDSPAIDTRAFATEQGLYWTSSGPAGFSNFKAVIRFRDGDAQDIRSVTSPGVYTRCVRDLP